MKYLLSKFRIINKITVTILVCYTLMACATIKNATDSTTSAVKNFDTDSVICLFSSCPGYKEFKTSRELYSQNKYQEALQSVESAITKEPKNEKYLKYKQEITLKIQSDRFVAIWDNYEAIPKEDLDKREIKLKELLPIVVILEANGDSNSSEKVNEELKRILAEKEEINILTRSIHNAFSTSDCDKGLELFLKIKPFKGYFVRSSTIFPSIENYQEKLDVYLDEEYKQRNYEKVIRLMEVIDKISENSQITQKRRTAISSFYKNRGTEFLNNKNIPTSLMFFALANRYKSDCVDKHLYDSTFAKLKGFKEELYVEVNSSWNEEDKKDFYKNIIYEEINKRYVTYFEKVNSLSDTTSQAILISLDRVENNIEQSQPQIKYSKFISGYNRVPNQVYYNAEQSINTARSELDRISRQPVRGWADAIANGLAQGIWQAAITNSQNTLNSDAAYDQIPILIDYTYTEKDIQISNLVQISYKVLDIKRKTIIKADTLVETSKNSISFLERVHPQDNDNLKNSEKFDYNEQRKEFNKFVDSTFRQVSLKISEESAKYFEERARDYLAIGETNAAVDSFLMGYILKNGTWTESVYDVLPSDLSAKLHELPLQSNLSKKLSARKNPIVMSKRDDSKGKTIKKQSISSAKLKESESDIPSLIEESKRKVVFIKSIAKNGISQGSGFFTSQRGHIITNHHVVKNSSAVIIKTYDGSEHVAKILKSDSHADLALLKIEISGVSFFRLCDHNNLEVGQTVIAIGAPLGLEQTVSKGIISAKRQISPSKAKSKLQMIQTDTQMTHGNSGGPLINLSGEVVGVNTLTLNTPGGPQGPVNFAISTEEIVKRMPEISREDSQN
ncbi:MAG: trypsin-like peptidase domain-containing protein [Syntrophales bacterium]